MEAVIMDGLRMVWLLLEGQRRKLIKYTYYLKEQFRIRRTPVFQLTTTSYDRPFLLQSKLRFCYGRRSRRIHGSALGF